MQLTHALAVVRRARGFYFEGRKTLPWPLRLAMSFALAAFTGLCAQLVIPATPVPVTGQVFGVLLAGLLLGGRFGALSQILDLAVGAVGVPWFAGSAAGPGVLTGVTGGYLIAFIPAAYLVGALTERFPCCRTLPGELLVMTAAIALIYAIGATWLAALLHANFSKTLQLAVLPFVGIDLLKAALAAAAARLILPPNPRRDI